MRDTNLALRLKDGSRVDVVYPDRIGRQYDTPWLDYPGSREWNIGIEETLQLWRSGLHFKYNPYFVVGKWGTGYGITEGARLIPFSEVSSVCELIPSLQRLGDDRHDKEAAEIKENIRLGSVVTVAQYEALEKRLAAVEESLHSMRNGVPFPWGTGPSRTRC